MAMIKDENNHESLSLILRKKIKWCCFISVMCIICFFFPVYESWIRSWHTANEIVRWWRVFLSDRKGNQNLQFEPGMLLISL